MKKRLSTICLVFTFFVGLAIMLYPVISDAWNAHTQSRAVASYEGTVGAMDRTTRENMLSLAEQFNEKLAADKTLFLHPESVSGEYESILNVSGTGVMGVVKIPKINVELPIYHTTAESVLQIGAGHLEGTSFPIGGKSTHAVVSGHRGLPSSRLFTDLDKLEEGDIFSFTVLDQTVTYQIDQIRIVEPSAVDDLQIVDGQDLATLFTCTPYGINSHRLLLRGHRIPNDAPVLNVAAEAVKVDPLMALPAVGLPMLVVILVIAVISNSREQKRRMRLAKLGNDMGLKLQDKKR